MADTTTATPTKKRKSKKAKTRQNKVKNLWTAPAKPLEYGREMFRYRVLRTARKLPALDIDSWTESVTWTRAGAGRSGQLTFRRPLGAHPASMIAHGDEIVCEWEPFGENGPWRFLWQMQVDTPSHQIKAGIISLALSSQLDTLSKSKVAWKYRKDKAHPDGWTAAQITAAVCKRFHIKIVSIPTASYEIHKFVQKSMSPIDVITHVWGLERKHTGRRFDIDTSTGGVNVTEIKEPKFLLILGAAMLDATVSQSLTGIASAVVATSTHTVKGHKKAKKLRAKVVDQGRERRYGYIVKTVTAPPRIKSEADLREWAKKQLATLYANKKELSFSHPGIPLLDRGTALRVYLPEADVDQIVFVTSVTHSLSAGSYEMQVAVGFSDPWAVDQKKSKVQQKKDAAAAERKRTRTRGAQHLPTYKKAATRANRR